MTTVADILTYMQTLAPGYMAEDWDNVGLLCGHKDRQVRKILVALDPFYSVCQEAIAEKADLIVTHHPLIFRDAMRAVNDESQTGRCVMTLIEHGIAAINAHTNLDKAPGGVNDVLAAALGLRNVEVVNPVGTDSNGQPYGLLRCGDVDEQSLSAFLAAVKERLHCKGLRYVDCGKSVRKVAVGGGSCADGMYEALDAGCDTFVTADIKYNQFRTAYELGLNLIDAGHFHTENPVCTYLTEKLREAFPDLNIAISAWHADCANFY